MLTNEETIELYEKHSKELFSYICRLVPSKDIAEEILHDVFVNLMEYSRKKNIDLSSSRAFLYKIAHNLSVNSIKKSKKLNSIPIDEEYALFADVDIEDEIINREIINELNNALQMLDPLSKSILIMKKELSMTFDEIADYHGISKKTAQRKLESAVSVLKNELKKAGHLSVMVFMFIFYLPYLLLLNREGK